MSVEQPQLNQEQIKPPLEKMEEIFGKKNLRTFEKFSELESKMVDVDSPKMEELFTIINWAEERKSKNPNFQDNLEKTESKALMALLQVLEKSPDPKKWSETVKKLSKAEGQKVVDLIEKRMMILGAQKRQEKADHKIKEIDKEIKNLDTLHTKLDFFIKNIH